MKSTGQRPQYTFQEIFDKKDVDLGMDNSIEPPKIGLPMATEPLYVEKPIGKYEPMKQSNRHMNRIVSSTVTGQTG